MTDPQIADLLPRAAFSLPLDHLRQLGREPGMESSVATMLRALPGGNETLNIRTFFIPACAAVLDRCSINIGSLGMFGSVKLARTIPPGNLRTPRLRGSNSRPFRLSVIIARCVSLIESEVAGRLGAVRESKKPDKRGICRIFVDCKWRSEGGCEFGDFSNL